MWSPQWAAGATRRGTVVVVLDQSPCSGRGSHITHLITTYYIQKARSIRPGKVLVGTINSAKKSAKMSSQPDDRHGQSFKPQTKDREPIRQLPPGTQMHCPCNPDEER